MAYLTTKKDAVDALIDPAAITASINAEKHAISRTLGYPGYLAAGNRPDAA